MKLILILTSLALYVILSQAQNVCRGYVPTFHKTCSGVRNEGHRFGRLCHRQSNNEMWYFELTNGTCLRMIYYGCGGNMNRFCNLNDCQKKCVRRE